MLDTYLAIDLGAQRLAAGVVDATGAVVVRDRVAAPSRHAWPALARLINRVLAATPAELVPIGCGVSCVGPVDQVTGRITPAHMPAWEGFELATHLTEEVGLPVSVRTGGQGLALAEQWCGSAVGATDLLAFLLSDVVEAGIISAGRLLEGNRGNAGGIGHLPVDPDGKVGSCGVDGCLDALVGLRAIEEETSRPLERTPQRLVERAGIMLGRAIASISALCDPAEVVVAGRGIHFLGEGFATALQAEVADRVRVAHLRPLPVRVLGPEASSPLLRAAAIARYPRVTPVGT